MTAPSPETTARKAEIVARYARGERHADIAAALGISIKYSSKVCRQAGLSRAAGERPRRVLLERQRSAIEARERLRAARAETQRRVVELYMSGRTHEEIGRELGIHRSTSAKVARRAGLGLKFGTPPRKTVGDAS